MITSKNIEGNDFTHHPAARPVEAAVKATSQAIELAFLISDKLKESENPDNQKITIAS